MAVEDLPAYDFHETDYDDYEALRDEFAWQIPETFNTASYVCDRWASDTPDAVAVHERRDDVTTYTYADLQREANQLANYLQEEGIGVGDRVAINAPQKIAPLVSMIATWKLGAVIVPLSVLFGHDGLSYRLTDADVSAFVVDEEAIDTYREIADDVDVPTVITIDTPPADGEVSYPEAIADRSDTFETVETAAEDEATIIYTSGTTGDPKGVVHAHRYLLANLAGYQLHVSNATLLEDDLFWSPVEWSWGATLYVIVLPNMFYGESLLGYPRGGFQPETALELIEEHDITKFFAPATVLRMILQSDALDQYDTSSVRVLASGGESLDREVRRAVRDGFGDIPIHEAYGQTEALTTLLSCERYFEAKPGMIGREAPGQEVAVLDPETQEPVEPGEIGEFAIPYEDNPVAFLEYLNKPDQTAEKVKDGWLLLEDLGWIDEDGYYGYHSRKDDVIISSGYRISPAEIEESVLEHEAVANVAVIGVPDDVRGEIPKAFVQLADAVDPSSELKEDLQEFVKANLAKYEYPRAIEFRDSLPTTTTGKIKRHELEE